MYFVIEKTMVSGETFQDVLTYSLAGSLNHIVTVLGKQPTYMSEN